MATNVTDKPAFSNFDCKDENSISSRVMQIKIYYTWAETITTDERKAFILRRFVCLFSHTLSLSSIDWKRL
jgi:hypothetical protein